MLALAATLAFFGCELSNSAPLVNAGGERLRGAYLASGVRAFLGIPYAAVPSGELRWRAPQPHTPRAGLQDATKFGPACPQGQANSDWYRSVASAMGAPPSAVPAITDISEACLFLNVWAPPDRDRNASSLPVMVWIHGGSNGSGFAHEPNYHGLNLAARGVIVVSLNYRVGLLGFLAHPALGDDATGRQGLLDQVAALQWIRSNIAAFGGDPGRVTVFGESAGGTDIYGLLHLNEAQGLFQRAIIQSGYIAGDAFTNRSAATKAALDLFGENASAAQMRKIPWQEIVALQDTRLPRHFYAPVVETDHVKHVPLLIGSNRDEWRMYLSEDVDGDYRQALAGLTPGIRGRVEAYLKVASSDRRARADYIMSAEGFLCPTARLADLARDAGEPAYVYLFTRVRPGPHDLGAYHGAEIPYAMETADAWLTSDARDVTLSKRMAQYWVNFAANGNPNGSGLPVWPAWAVGRQAFELGDDLRPLPSDIFSLCELIEE